MKNPGFNRNALISPGHSEPARINKLVLYTILTTVKLHISLTAPILI